MSEQIEQVDLNGDMRLERAVFSEWLSFGQRDQGRCLCAVAVMRYALDQQGLELPNAVTGTRRGSFVAEYCHNHSMRNL